MSSLHKPIFVVGCPRSGTTLVQCILSASSHAFSLPETHFFSQVLPELNALPETRFDRDGLRQLRQALEEEADVPPVPELWSTLDNTSGPRAIDVFVALVERFRPVGGQHLRAIEKTPRHVLHLDTLGAVFPDACFVNVVRDPIDVVGSLLSVPFASSRSVISQAQRWTESIAAARSYAQTWSGRVHTVLHERLVREPEETTRDLCRFVDVPYEPRMLEEFGREASRNVGRGEIWKRDVARGVLLDRQGVWRERLTPGQAWLVAQATADARRSFGYDSVPSASGVSIARALLKEVRVRFGEARTSVGVVGAARYAGSVLKTLAPA